MVSVFRRQLAARDLVDDFNARNDLHGKRQRRLPPRFQTLLIFQIESGRRRIRNLGDRAKMIVHLIQNIRLCSAGQIEKLVGAVGEGIKVKAPEYAVRSNSEHVRQTDCGSISDQRRSTNRYRIAPGIAALVYPDSDMTRRNVDQIRCAVAIHVTKQEPFWIEAGSEIKLGVFKQRAVPHNNAPAPSSVSKIRPVFNAAVVNQRDVLQAVAGEIA